MFKYLNVFNDLERLIQTGELKEGDKLPSIRSLSTRYQCTKSTIIRALQELEKRHMIYSVLKSGYYVVKKTNENHVRHSSVIDFATSAPDPDVFPYLDFQHCINKAIDTYKNDLFIYGTPKGLPSLIRVVQRQLMNCQVFTNEENLFITSGVQQALSLLTSIPFPNKKNTILIEQPSYHLFIEYLETHGIPVIGIKRTAEGIDLNELERIFQTEGIKFFYTMPRFHNPLGTSYSKKEKKAIVRLAKKYDVFIVEDDYLADLERDAKADPMYSYDDSSHVIYLKSFSKIIFPGLRVGVAVIPDCLTESFLTYKKLQDIDSSMISQAALEVYIKSGMFERHKQKIRASYYERSNRLAASLKEGSSINKQLFQYHDVNLSCVHTHIILNKKIIVQPLIRKLLQNKVLINLIGKNYLSSFPKEKLLKLNVSNVKAESIEEGICKCFLQAESAENCSEKCRGLQFSFFLKIHV
ncbi:PLP-dependent aminotransferase family protein [Bacillus multifaciens]|uniref:aminotransferase-like domain-containing protein n=1 Tax=Bacillus multifaciens TaxID=3068506 RepID=UPI002741E878|nr:PLP-dependent aminotransferase family protein [Bacillus sp. WLY-B-L8]MDP7978028.1 PLP-dependent aminotransferase family protein [Bacillus sp. WLY-B-L8]